MSEITASTLDIICRRCGHEFPSQPKFFFAGLQSSKCPACRKTVVYPLTRGWRAVWWTVATLTAGAGVWANITLHQGFSWIPGGIGLLSFVALCVDVGIRYRVDRATRPVVAAESVTDAELAARQGKASVRPVAATPGYVAVLTLTIALTSLSSLLGGFVVVGLNGSYETRVIDRLEGDPIQEFVGYDLVAGTSDICSGGQDYWACTAMHNTMWNALCTGPDTNRTSRARQTCADLYEFIVTAWARYKSCGYGCETGGGDGAKWGWSNYRLSPVSNRIQQPSVSHIETCYFSLGAINIGYCPRS